MCQATLFIATNQNLNTSKISAKVQVRSVLLHIWVHKTRGSRYNVKTGNCRRGWA